ncbi:fumarylacetoacetate hydrolase family protein [Halobacteria archaeon AArc-curdl1]|uniref:Fumarylacetoacetate hydrolase family protein n=1 Tax=Natronosalvus hydrolyticus TaxID=2979988 RepID=A0AAP2Z654_9EURY|nr:fumarylacetoacetate hydrolase family protein [Halobacteria archaeon AArc-curdl1]
MTRLAQTVNGVSMIGDEEGFMPLSAAYPELETVDDALRTAANNDLAIPESASGERTSPDNLSFGSPLTEIGKLWGIGLNYAEHASDLDETRPTEPASFMKPATAVVGPGGPIRLPPEDLTSRVTAEAELGVVIGRSCKGISKDEADQVIAGYLPIIDMTAEDILEKNPRYLTRSKSFDSFIVFGSWITTTDEVGSLENVRVKTTVNGRVNAENTVSNMMTPPHDLVSYHSHVMTLEPGDIISTGTPGAHVIRSGDKVKADVGAVGSVSAHVVQD